jgi:branched-chain amino acid transport system permease protein
MDAVLQYLATGIMVGSIYGLIALSIVLICKATGVFNFAVGQFVMLGGFIYYALANQLGLNVWISFPLSLVIAFVVGALANRLTMQPLIGQPIGTQMMVTLALVSFINGITLVIWGGNVQVISNFFPGDFVSIGNTTFSTILIGAFIVTILVIGAFALFFQKSKYGLAMRATAESHKVAQARGINVRVIFTLTWALSALIAAVAGIFLGMKVGVAIPMGDIGLKAFAAVLFGGVDSVLGAIVGGLLVGIMETLSGGLLNPWLMEITPFIIIVLILIVRPGGLFGQKRIERI